MNEDQHPVHLETAARLIRLAAHSAYLLALGHRISGCYEKFKNPQPGDFVWESSSAYMRDRDWHAVGKLLRTAREPIPMEWDVAVNGPRPTEFVWYIELLDGRESRWTNAEFLKVPAEPIRLGG